MWSRMADIPASSNWSLSHSHQLMISVNDIVIINCVPTVLHCENNTESPIWDNSICMYKRSKLRDLSRRKDTLQTPKGQMGEALQ